MLRTSFYILVILTIVCCLLSAFTVMVEPRFQQAAAVPAMSAVILGAVRYSKRTGKTAAPLVCCALILPAILLTGFVWGSLYPRERHAEYTSPQGTATVVIEYDLASRPRIYRKHNALFMTNIPFSFGPGYNETVNHSVEWLSETEILLTDPMGGTWTVAVS